METHKGKDDYSLLTVWKSFVNKFIHIHTIRLNFTVLPQLWPQLFSEGDSLNGEKQTAGHTTVSL